jgi:histidinol-phosphatase (PHP family)
LSVTEASFDRHAGVTPYALGSVSLPLVDYHVHTARCGHASGAMERYVEHAIAAGLTELGFSDHLFMYWLPPDRRDPELGMAEWEHDFYIEDVERCRRRYASDITIRLATEADFIPGHEAELEAILRRYDWDYVIGSVHFVDDWGFDDARYLSGFDAWDVDALYARYFDLVGASAETGLFDTIGHADLVKKFGHRPTEDQSEPYARLAARFSKTGVCVEVNTAGLRKPVGEMYPHPDLLRACRVAGVQTTVGSDAHAPNEVAADLATAAQLMRQVGYETFVKYAGRRRTAIPLAPD